MDFTRRKALGRNLGNEKFFFLDINGNGPAESCEYQEEEATIRADGRKTGRGQGALPQARGYARSVTLFQIAIAVAAISALTPAACFSGISLCRSGGFGLLHSWNGRALEVVS